MKALLVLLLANVFLAECLDHNIKIKDIKFARLKGTIAENARIPKKRPSLTARIIGGTSVLQLPVADQALYKHQALLLSENEFNIGSWNGCGGSLITQNFVLTAAHCLLGTEFSEELQRDIHFDGLHTNIYFGVLHLDDVDEDTIRSFVPRANRIIHQGWNPDPNRLSDDIALLRLPEPIQLVPNRIDVIALPIDDTCAMNFEGMPAEISGYGLVENRMRTLELKAASTIIRANQLCAALLPAFRAETNICAIGNIGQNTCSGDSGGPLVVTDANLVQRLVGVTSFGAEDCEAGFPDVYTKVCSYRDWINGHLNNAAPVAA